MVPVCLSFDGRQALLRLSLAEAHGAIAGDYCQQHGPRNLENLDDDALAIRSMLWKGFRSHFSEQIAK